VNGSTILSDFVISATGQVQVVNGCANLGGSLTITINNVDVVNLTLIVANCFVGSFDSISVDYQGSDAALNTCEFTTTSALQTSFSVLVVANCADAPSKPIFPWWAIVVIILGILGVGTVVGVLIWKLRNKRMFKNMKNGLDSVKTEEPIDLGELEDVNNDVE